MSYRISQDFEYSGNDYWRWSAWIEGDDVALEEVISVEWILHPSFKRNRIVSRDRDKRFRLDASGWGTFRLRAELQLSSGETVKLLHELRLEYPADGESAVARDAAGQGAADSRDDAATVFLSYSVQDSRFAAKIRKDLQKNGFTVLDQTQVEAGEMVSGSLKRMIERAHAVIGVTVEDEISSWVRRELDAATIADKPALMVVGPDTSLQSLPAGIRALQVDLDRPDASTIAQLLRSELRT